MTDEERVRIEAGERIKVFSTDNAADFATGVPHNRITSIKSELVLSAQYAVDQAEGGGDAAMGFESKDTGRENLRDMMQQIADTAKVMIYLHDGINDKFRMPRSRSDQSVLATAKAWLAELPTYETDFKNHGMADDFLTVFGDLIAAFEASFATPASGVSERVAATALLGESIRRMMISIRILDQVMRNKYADQPGKLAAWISASRVEKPPKKKAPPTP